MRRKTIHWVADEFLAFFVAYKGNIKDLKEGDEICEVNRNSEGMWVIFPSSSMEALHGEKVFRCEYRSSDLARAIAEALYEEMIRVDDGESE